MKRFLLVLACWLGLVSAWAQTPAIEQWKRFETSWRGPTAGNPFTDVWLNATFTNGQKSVKVKGFYDGNGLYKVRFMPTEPGSWTFVTESNVKALQKKSGQFTCTAPSADNHGPVRVRDTYYFQYSDGKPYHPFGTTAYAWTHQPQALEEQTLTALKNSGFNKIRMCVFPKFYAHVTNEPPFYPYERKGTKNDLSRFNPAFFEHLEKRVDDLAALGIEADLIIFHPYDKGHWGFDSMGTENDLRYIEYLTARLSSFQNVWWSLANEFDYIKTKTRGVWDTYSKAVVANDPYRHLCSIHNGSVYYDYWKPEFTHVSIQNGSVIEEAGRAVLLRDVYNKPVVYDEVCYEGNVPQRWGQLSGEEMTHAFWQGIMAGTYVTHGETYMDPNQVIFWAKGGPLKGTSPARIAFLRKLVEAAPRPYELADPWKDHQTAVADSSHYLIYLGKSIQPEWEFSLPKKSGPAAGKSFQVELIDTWDMTITPLSETFVIDKPEAYRIFDTKRKKVRLPLKPYLALRITEIAAK